MSSNKEVKVYNYDPEIDLQVPMKVWDYLKCLAQAGVMAGLLSGFVFPASWLLMDRVFFGENDPGRFYNLDSEATMFLRICGVGFVGCFLFLVFGAVWRKRELKKQ